MSAPSRRPEYARLYKWYWRKYGYRAKVDGTVARRKIAALQGIGYSIADIAREMGTTRQALSHMFHRSGPMHVANAKAIGAVYDRLHMTPAEGVGANRTRTLARKAGYPPPFAWDDIEDLTDVPTGVIEPCCIAKPHAKGLCQKHYTRLKKSTELKGSES